MSRILQAQEAWLVGGQLMWRRWLRFHLRWRRRRLGRLHRRFGDAACECPYRKHAKNDAKSPRYGRAE